MHVPRDEYNKRDMRDEHDNGDAREARDLRDIRDDAGAKVPRRILAFEATEDEVITWYMRGVLARAGGNQCEAQRILAIDRSTIRRRIEKLRR